MDFSGEQYGAYGQRGRVPRIGLVDPLFPDGKERIGYERNINDGRAVMERSSSKVD